MRRLAARAPAPRPRRNLHPGDVTHPWRVAARTDMSPRGTCDVPFAAFRWYAAVGWSGRRWYTPLTVRVGRWLDARFGRLRHGGALAPTMASFARYGDGTVRSDYLMELLVTADDVRRAAYLGWPMRGFERFIRDPATCAWSALRYGA